MTEIPESTANVPTPLLMGEKTAWRIFIAAKKQGWKSNRGPIFHQQLVVPPELRETSDGIPETLEIPYQAEKRALAYPPFGLGPVARPPEED